MSESLQYTSSRLSDQPLKESTANVTSTEALGNIISQTYPECNNLDHFPSYLWDTQCDIGTTEKNKKQIEWILQFDIKDVKLNSAKTHIESIAKFTKK